jgi:hypothetical protein
MSDLNEINAKVQRGDSLSQSEQDVLNKHTGAGGGIIGGLANSGGFIGGLVGSPLVSKIFAGIVLIVAMGMFYGRYKIYFNTVFLVIALRIIFGILKNRIPLLQRIPRLLVAAGFVAILLIGFIEGRIYYSTALDKANLNHDRIIAQKDGGPVSVYEKKSTGGKAIAALAEGVDVKILGATRDREYYKVETPEGETGFVTAAAFADGTMSRKWTLFRAVMGGGQGEITSAQIQQTKVNLNETIDALMPTIESIMKAVNISSEPNEKGDNDFLTIHSIAYRDDFTVLKVEYARSSIDTVTLGGAGGMEPRSGTFYIQDVDAARKNPQGGLAYGINANRPYEAAAGKTGQYLFFRPFTTKYFHLIRGNDIGQIVYDYDGIPEKEQLDSGEAVVSCENLLYVSIP